MNKNHYLQALFLACMLALTGCASIPTSGPSTAEIQKAGSLIGADRVQIVDVDDAIARQLLAQRTLRLFSDTIARTSQSTFRVGEGDVLEVTIWEASPATLFSAAALDPRSGSSGSRPTVVSDLVVDSDGAIRIPFAGKIQAAGQSLPAIGYDIERKLTGKANQPEAIVRVVNNASANVTVVGEVSSSKRVPLTPSGERLLDVLAAAGGVRQPINKMTIQLTRGNSVFALPLETIIRDPRQNIPLVRGDVVTALFQTQSFTALGATGKNEEIQFDSQGISLAQALARVGGLQDNRSDAKGLFIFRFEKRDALRWSKEPKTTPDGLVPVVYRVNLQDPNSFFVMQSFAMSDKDMLYVSNAPVTEVQKFLNVVFSVAYPLLNVIQVTK